MKYGLVERLGRLAFMENRAPHAVVLGVGTICYFSGKSYFCEKYLYFATYIGRYIAVYLH